MKHYLYPNSDEKKLRAITKTTDKTEMKINVHLDLEESTGFDRHDQHELTTALCEAIQENIRFDYLAQHDLVFEKWSDPIDEYEGYNIKVTPKGEDNETTSSNYSEDESGWKIDFETGNRE